MNKCKKCGSFAINYHMHGRNPEILGMLDYCDVCYWRVLAEQAIEEKQEMNKERLRYLTENIVLREKLKLKENKK